MLMAKAQFPESRGYGNQMEIHTSNYTEDVILAREIQKQLDASF